MFEDLVDDAAWHLGLPAAGVSVLVGEVLTLLMNDQSGGIEGFAGRFRRAGLSSILTSWFGGREGMPVTGVQLESALGTGTLDRMADASGLGRSAVAAALAFLLPRMIGRLTGGGSLPSTRALQARLSSSTGRVHQSPVVPDGSHAGGWRRWLPWAAAAMLAVAAVLWLRTSGAPIEPQLTLTNQNGRITYSGVVRDEATHAAIGNALRARFGDANVAGGLRVDRKVRPAAWLPHAHDLVAAVQRSGTELSLTGDVITAGGSLSPADREALTNRLKAVIGTRVGR